MMMGRTRRLALERKRFLPNPTVAVGHGGDIPPDELKPFGKRRIVCHSVAECCVAHRVVHLGAVGSGDHQTADRALHAPRNLECIDPVEVVLPGKRMFYVSTILESITFSI